MADQSNKSPAQIDREALEKFNRMMMEDLKREERIIKFQQNRGSNYPPMSIEPMAQERARLSGPNAMMTPEDRALRKQWIMDQRLAPHEPVYIPELHTKNVISRMLAKPWDTVFNTLRPLIGNSAASHGRVFIPKFAAAIFVIYASWYHLKYNHNDWTRKGGWHWYATKPTVLPGDKDWPKAPTKDDKEFGSRGFNQRKVFEDPKTSYA